MSIKIVNWKLATIALVFFCLFTSLGMWQLLRAQQKEILLKSFTERTEHAPFTAQELNHVNDWRFYQVELEGYFDNAHTILLDNKTHYGKVGYEVYTPFIAAGLDSQILVDRGFIPLGKSRAVLPTINTPNSKVVIRGMLNQPPTYVALGQMLAEKKVKWPLLVEYIEINSLSNFMHASLFPYILTLSPTDKAAYEIEWRAVTTGPERNQGYAVQWFALAITLLILFVALNRKRKP